MYVWTCVGFIQFGTMFRRFKIFPKENFAENLEHSPIQLYSLCQLSTPTFDTFSCDSYSVDWTILIIMADSNGRQARPGQTSPCWTTHPQSTDDWQLSPFNHFYFYLYPATAVMIKIISKFWRGAGRVNNDYI